MTSSFLGGILTPPLPLRLTRHFLATPPPCARNSRQNWFRDKTAYVVFLTTVEVPLQPGTVSPATLSVTILPFGMTKDISSEDLIIEDWQIYIES